MGLVRKTNAWSIRARDRTGRFSTFAPMNREFKDARCNWSA